MLYSFQDTDNLYLVMDLHIGGDLRYNLEFFIGCILIALEYIHSNNIIHRDLKPENLVCDSDGYIHITDFGIAKYNTKNNRKETSGTPGYMAPEVLCGQHHSYGVDFFALGVIVFEFMLGRRPYHGKNRKEYKEDVLSHQVRIKDKHIPNGWSRDAVEFVNGLMQRKMERRLGVNGIYEVIHHAWLRGFDWKGVKERKVDSPFEPNLGDNYNKKYCECEDKLGEDTKERYLKYKNDMQYNSLFQNYTFNNIPKEELHKYSKTKTNTVHLFKSTIRLTNNSFPKKQSFPTAGSPTRNKRSSYEYHKLKQSSLNHNRDFTPLLQSTYMVKLFPGSSHKMQVKQHQMSSFRTSLQMFGKCMLDKQNVKDMEMFQERMKRLCYDNSSFNQGSLNSSSSFTSLPIICNNDNSGSGNGVQKYGIKKSNSMSLLNQTYGNKGTVKWKNGNGLSLIKGKGSLNNSTLKYFCLSNNNSFFQN